MGKQCLWLVVLAACGGGSDTDPGVDGGTTDDGGGPIVPGGDPTFGEHGLATVNLGGGLAGLTAIAHQSDGKIVAVGATQEAIVVVRTSAAGELDPAFGSGGTVELPFGLPTNGVGNNQASIVVQADDKIVVTGALHGGVYDVAFHTAIVRLSADGALDQAFGIGGIALSPKNASLTTLIALPDGKLLAGGTVLARFAADGSLDTTFGMNGIATPAAGASAIALAPDGSIYAGGQTIAHLSADGAIDQAFGTGGKVVLANPTYANQLYAIAVQPDGKLVAAGAILTTGSPGQQAPFAVIRATAAGVLDTTFGGGDGIADDASTTGGAALGIALVPGGILAIGPSRFGGTPRSCVRLDATGALDATYSCDIGLTIALGGPHVLADGAFLVPGVIATASKYALAMSMHTAAGATDDSFGSSGVFQRGEGGSFDRAQALAVQPDGAVLVGGWSGVGGGSLVRLSADGQLDTSFGAAGIAKAPSSLALLYVSGIATQPGGKLVITGLPQQNGFVAARLDATGALDPTFGTAGIVQAKMVGTATSVQSHAMAVGADGSLYLAGEVTDVARTAGQFAVLHLGADGAIDTAYGGAAGALTTFTSMMDNQAKQIVVAPDGSAYVFGIAANTPTLVRFDPTGALDTAFGSIAFAPPGPTGAAEVFGLVRQDDGKLVAIAGRSETGELDLVRVDAAGVLDAGFGTAGKVTLQLGGGNGYRALQAPMGVALDASGKLLVGVAISTEQTLMERAAIVRLNTDGTPDADHGTNGVKTIDLGAGSSSIHALLFQDDGKLLTAGRRWTAAGSSDFAVLRTIY